MKHPSEYTTVPFNGMHVMVVDAGTKITNERTGEEIVVDDNTIARKGSVIWCTKAVFEELKSKFEETDDVTTKH